MTKLTSLLRQGLLAVALAGTALGALAAPTSYHVAFNTAPLAANAQYIDFMFTYAGNAAPVTATVSNLSGLFGTVADQAGTVSVNGDGTLTLGNGAAPGDLNYIDFNALFGGMFGFDISFDTGFRTDPSTDGSVFSLAVLDANLNPLGGDFLAQFTLTAANDIVAVQGAGGLATISANVPAAVPEPSGMLMMMTGVGLVGFVARRRKQSAA
jgi:hypothetical protein